MHDEDDYTDIDGKYIDKANDDRFSDNQLTLTCKRCGGNEFHVGQRRLYTSIMCVTCKWEKCIHEG